MKKFLIGLWIAALMLSSFAAVPLGQVTAAALEGDGSPLAAAAQEGFTGTKNTAEWKPDPGVDYSKYHFLGRGEELLKDVQEKYPDYTAAYRLDGRDTNTDELNRMVNVMAVYKDADSAAKTLTVEVDSIQIRVQCEYTELRGSAGSFMSVSFTTNLPSVFIAGISANQSDNWYYDRGLIYQDNLRPTGENGTYTAKVKLTIPFVEPGRYYLNFYNDSWNAGYPHLLTIPLDITEGAYSDSPYHLLYAGDWDLITAEGYQDSLTKLFYNSYPRLYARFGLGSEPKTITFKADKDYDGVAYSQGQTVVVSVDYANANPRDIGFFSHEITHSVQQYTTLSYDGDKPDDGLWWIENMANYGGFRYFHWSDADFVQIYQAGDTSLQDWGYQAYGNNKWFFAYMDAKYPTVREPSGQLKYGLIDSINRLIKTHTGEQLTANPRTPGTPFSQVVKDVTGYDCIESLRLHYVEELQSGSWSFTGFGDYADNFITEDLPGVPNPNYPAVTAKRPGGKTAARLGEVVSGAGNLCLDGRIHRFSGQTGSHEGAALLIDGDEGTKWCSTSGSVNDQAYCLDGTRQWVMIDLGGWKSFDTYTVFNTRSKEGFGNMTEWELLVSDDGKDWTSVDYQPSCNEAKASFDVGRQSGRYLLLKAYNPDDSGPGTIRLYEFQVFNREGQPDPEPPADPTIAERARRVEEKIAAIGKVDYSVACGERIEAARAAYNAADAEVREAVSNLAVLQKAEKDYAALFQGVRKVDNAAEITPISGPGEGGERFDKMFDGKTDTKFGAWNPSDPILFSADQPIVVKYYAFTTGGDSAQWPGRNPKNWTLYGCNDYDPGRDGSWKEIDAEEGNGDMPDLNGVEVRFAVDNPAAYQYYKLVFRNHETWLQLSEVSLYALEATVELADYTAVDRALAKVPADLSLYTDASAAGLQSAVKAVVRALPKTEQKTVDGYAAAIEQAVAKLAYKDADYSKVDAALAKVPEDLSVYTDESVAALQNAVKAVVRGKDITEQETVDGYAAAIEKAVSRLNRKGGADYSKVDECLEIVDTLNPDDYEDFSAVLAAVDAVVRGMASADQADVDAMAKAIEEAIANLKPKADIVPGDMDGNGEVTIQDVMEACKVLARQSAGKAPAEDEMKRGDLDGDGKFTITDVMEICKILARKA